MVIGSGMLAQVFDEHKESNDITIFASGISDSKETRPEAFLREQKLLEAAIDHKLFIYFSTTSIQDPLVSDSLYVKHKDEMESLIRKNSKRFIIFRLSQVSGIGGNPNTLVNALAFKILNDETIPIYKNASRNIINTNDVRNIVNNFISIPKYHNETINIATPWDLSINFIIDTLEEFLKIKAHRLELEKGSMLRTDISHIKDIGYIFIPDNPKGYLLDTFENLKK